jgi:hypothetical protein
MNNENDEGEIVIKLEENMQTITPDDPNEYITVKTKQEKQYLQWLKEKGIYSKIGLQTKLDGMRLYQEWTETKTDGEVRLSEEYQGMSGSEILDKIREEKTIDSL